MNARSGIALVMALLVLVIVEAMTAGILVLSTNARVVAASELRTRRAENAAEFAVQTVLAGWAHGGFDTLAIGQIVGTPAGGNSAPDLSQATTVERLASALYVVRARAHAGRGLAYARAHATATARLLDKRALLEESNVAISSGGLAILTDSRIDARPDYLPDTWADSLCPPVDSLPLPEALTAGEPPVLDASVTADGGITVDSSLVVFDSVALGRVKWSELEDIADRVERGAVMPRPALIDEQCLVAAPANWGDPVAGAPCSLWFPLVYAPSDLVMQGGTGQGILAVEGMLTLTDGAVFVGYIVARDGILIEDGSSVVGSVRTRRGAALFDRSTVSYSRCAIARATVLSPASLRLVTQPRRFLPAF